MARHKEDIINIEEGKIRKHFDEKWGENFYSIVDIIAIITKSSDPRNYWKVLKNRLKNSQNKLVTECNQLKMIASDGKLYLTDTANSKTLLEIVEMVSPVNVDTFRRWFKDADSEFSTGKESLSSFFDPNGENLQAELLIDAYQTNDDIVVRAFIAGVIDTNLFISTTCGEVTIEGKREPPENISGSNCLQQELYWGEFLRTIVLPEEIDIEEAEASIQYGLLTIKLPKLNKKASRIIKIKSI
jgi:HSP20 family molecular chaperone IbpA